MAPTRLIGTYLEVLFVFGIVISLLLYRQLSLYRRRAQHSTCRNPPKYPQKRFLLGLDTLQETIASVKSKRYLERLQFDYARYGNTFSKHYLFTFIVCTIEPANLKCILASNFRDYGITTVRKEAFRPFLGNNILTADGAEWTHARAKLRPSFSKRQTSDLQMFEVHVSWLISALQSKGEGKVIDLKDFFLRLTADIATESFYGESVDSLLSDSVSPVMEAFQIANRGCEDRARRGKLARFFPQGEYNRSIRIMKQYVQRYISDNKHTCEKQPPSEAAQTEKHVLLHELRKVIDDPDRLRDELLTILFAGRDTTGSLLCSLFFTLARRKDIWARLRSEVAYLNGQKPKDEDLQRMRFTRYCLNESKLEAPSQDLIRFDVIICEQCGRYGLTRNLQHFDFTHPYRITPASQSKIPLSPQEGDLKARIQSSSPKGRK